MEEKGEGGLTGGRNGEWKEKRGKEGKRGGKREKERGGREEEQPEYIIASCNISTETICPIKLHSIMGHAHLVSCQLDATPNL